MFCVAKFSGSRRRLEQIGAHGRTPRNERPSDSGGDWETLKSRSQLQHEWYGSHSELNWRDRELAEMYGMDADTYKSNVLENDKD